MCLRLPMTCRSGARHPCCKEPFILNLVPSVSRAVKLPTTRPAAATRDAADPESARVLFPRRSSAEDAADDRPSTSGRRPSEYRDGPRRDGGRGGYRQRGDESSRREGRGRRDYDDEGEGRGLGRGEVRGRREYRRGDDDGKRYGRTEGAGLRERERKGGDGERGQPDGRPRRQDGFDGYDGRRRDSERGEWRERPERERGSDRDSRRRHDADPQDPTASAIGTNGDAAAVVAPRPPGSSTGNKPLPYDLPLVRPHDGDKGTFFAGSSWRQAGASDELVAALRSLGVARPSHIQAQAFSAFRGAAGAGEGSASTPSGGGGALVLADQAGSGKTLAYLLPLLQELREEEAAAGRRVTQPRSPRGIVVAPTVELVQQVYRVVRALSGAGLKCRSAAVTGGQRDEKARAASFRTQKELLAEGVDLLVATPGRLLKHLQAGNLGLGACKALVLDEVDVLLGDKADFMAQVEPLRSAAPASMRFLMVTATLPQHVFAQLREVWPDLQAVFGPGLHRTASGLVEELVDCSGGDEVSEESGRKRKLEALQSLLDRHRAARTMVFCNKIESCRDVENFLARADPRQEKYKVLPYHEAIRDDLRSAAMAEFLRPVAQQVAAAGGEGGGQGPAAAGGEVPLVLVATDRTSRGIDVLYCEHVVLFDFPRDPSEYVRRVGRTARGAGGRGTVSSLVLGRQVPLAQEIISRNQKGMPVHSVPE